MSSRETKGYWSQVGLQIKYRNDDTLDKHKTRLVIKGYAQRQGIDYEDTFAPDTRMATIRTTLAIASKKRWPVY